MPPFLPLPSSSPLGRGCKRRSATRRRRRLHSSHASSAPWSVLVHVGRCCCTQHCLALDRAYTQEASPQSQSHTPVWQAGQEEPSRISPIRSESHSYYGCTKASPAVVWFLRPFPALSGRAGTPRSRCVAGRTCGGTTAVSRAEPLRRGFPRPTPSPDAAQEGGGRRASAPEPGWERRGPPWACEVQTSHIRGSSLPPELLETNHTRWSYYICSARMNFIFILRAHSPPPNGGGGGGGGGGGEGHSAALPSPSFPPPPPGLGWVGDPLRRGWRPQTDAPRGNRPFGTSPAALDPRPWSSMHRKERRRCRRPPASQPASQPARAIEGGRGIPHRDGVFSPPPPGLACLAWPCGVVGGRWLRCGVSLRPHRLRVGGRLAVGFAPQRVACTHTTKREGLLGR